ncbi:hypothetical protein TWF217_009418 [Orbilia oligospora]|nr:hypothetical protein TWF217_009418 [Orbilia oligospora]
MIKMACNIASTIEDDYDEDEEAKPFSRVCIEQNIEVILSYLIDNKQKPLQNKTM